MDISVKTKDGGIIQIDYIQNGTKIAIYGDGGEYLVTDWMAARNLANIIIGMTAERYKAFKKREQE